LGDRWTKGVSDDCSVFSPRAGDELADCDCDHRVVFGGAKLPQLAKALGQSKKAFKDGWPKAKRRPQRKRSGVRWPVTPKGRCRRFDDEELFEEARRRARLRVAEGSIPEERK